MEGIKIHLGCGPVYLEGYYNCDVKCKGHYLVVERPDLVEKNKTTIDNYYKKKVDRMSIQSKQYHNEEVVVDLYAKAHKLPFPDNTIEEIRSYQMFEHFMLPEAEKLLKYWRKKLVDRGVLYLDIPDLAQTAWEYVNAKSEEDKEWWVRLLYGSHKNKYGVHKMMYSRDSIAKLLYKTGYNDLEFFPNIHFYPAFGVKALKY
jgi:predicted SAM-dependent methyltransferase